MMSVAPFQTTASELQHRYPYGAHGMLIALPISLILWAAIFAVAL